MESDPAALEVSLGHVFQDRGLLRRALTHKSRAFEEVAGGAQAAGDNERLEFLGDSVLGFIVSEVLLKAHPGFPEGRLSKLRAQLVRASHLYHVARELGVGDHLLLGHGEEMSGGRLKKNLLSDAVEALIAAIYLDGGMDAARRFVERHIIRDPAELEAAPDEAGRDFKSALQEVAQMLKLPHPRYRIIAEHGPEHSKTFSIEVRVGKDWVGRAEGGSKKAAGQQAAQRLLEQLEPTLHPASPPHL